MDDPLWMILDGRLVMEECPEIETLLRDAASRLTAVSDSPRLDAEILLGKAIDMPRSYLYAHPEDTPDAAAVQRLEQTISRRLAGEPIAYILGHKEFWSMPIMVSPATLVPRPETELIVELALREIPLERAWRVLDLGTGSGAIAVAVAKERPLIHMTAIDSCDDALAIANQNIRQLDLGNVRCLKGDWTAPVRNDVFELIVSNPPYVRSDDPALQQLSHEPRAALRAGPDGLDAIRKLARECLPILADSGALLLEHGAEQQQAVLDLLSAEGWSSLVCHNDLSGRPRVTIARKPA